MQCNSKRPTERDANHTKQLSKLIFVLPENAYTIKDGNKFARIGGVRGLVAATLGCCFGIFVRCPTGICSCSSPRSRFVEFL